MGEYFDLEPSALHQHLWDRFGRLHKGQNQRISYIAPRGGGKTSITSKAYPLYAICHELKSYIILMSDTQPLAQQNLSAIKEQLAENNELTEAYPWACGQGETWSETKIVTRNGILVEALGTGTKIRGRTRGKFRPDLVIGDDLESDEMVESPESRRKRQWWFKRALLPAVARGGDVLVIGTALHPDDLIQNLKKTPGWEHYLFQSIIQEPDRSDLWKEFREIISQPTPNETLRMEHERRAREFYRIHHDEMHAGAKVLWPAAEPLYDLMVLRAEIGEAAFQSEKQGNPVSSKVSEFADELLREGIWFTVWPATPRRVIYCDPSKGQTEKSDYSAIVELGQTAAGYFYCDADLQRRDVVQICADLLDRVEACKPDAVGIEENGFHALGELLLRLAGERGMYVPLYKITNTDRKIVRVRKWVTPPLRNRILQFQAGSPGADLLVSQLREFPTGQYDDGPDGLAGAFQLFDYVAGGGVAAGEPEAEPVGRF